ncbi:MAG: hypothetical protein ACRC78_23810, partial [Planktothrix sp.]
YIMIFQFPKRSRIQTLQRLKRLNDSSFIKTLNFSDLTIPELKGLNSDNLLLLYKKEITRLKNHYISDVHSFEGEKLTYFYECEIKQLTKALKKFRDRCVKIDLDVLEFETECVHFIVDKNKRFIFKSKNAQRFYNFKNALTAGGLGLWGYKAVSHLGSVQPWKLKREIFNSCIPIAFFTGITFKFWSYIAKDSEPLSETLDLISTISLSPIWLLETFLNKITSLIDKRFNQVPIPINVVGEIQFGPGLTWKQLKHTTIFVKEMVNNFDMNYFQ